MTEGLVPAVGRPVILVVDDVPANIMLLFGLLKDEYEVRMATSGQAALDLCRSRVPDLVLLDVEMPGMDGFAVCTAMKAAEATGSVPVVFVSAHQGAAYEVLAFERGAADFIAKPFDSAVLKARIRRLIDKTR